MSLLEIRNITKSFGDNRAVDDVSLTIRKGEFLGLIGSNGAGKTTLVNLISGFFPADRGALVFDGRDITRQSINERIRVGIARSFQLVNLFDQLTVLDNVALTIFARQGKTRWLWTLADRDGAVRDEAVAVLRQFGMEAQGGHARRGHLAGRAEAPRRGAWPTRSARSSCSSTSRRAASAPGRRRRSWTSSPPSSAPRGSPPS